MNTDSISISLPELISILGLAVTVSGIFGTLVWNLWRKVMDNASAVKISHQQLSDEIHEFKLTVAQKYVSSSRLADMEQKMLLSEERLHSSLENLSSRIDRLLERMERT